MPFLMLLQTYWRPIAIALLGAFIYGKGYWDGNARNKQALDALKGQIEAQLQASEIIKKQAEERQAQINLQTKEKYDNDIAALKSYYASHPRTMWLSNTPPSCVMPVIPETTKRTADAPARTEQAVAIDLEKAGEEVIWYKKLLEWVEKQ